MYSVCMCYVMGYVQYCYVFVSDGMADDVLFVVIVAVKAFMAQLLSPRQISLNGTIKYIILYRKSFKFRGGDSSALLRCWRKFQSRIRGRPTSA